MQAPATAAIHTPSSPAADEPVRIIRADHLPAEAMADLLEGLARYEIWSRFAFHEIRQRFRRSVLGPFWLTASMGVFVLALGVISTSLFHQDVSKTMPYIAVGIIIWGLLTSCITEGSTLFTTREGYIRNVPLPISVHLYQMLMRNLVICGFNMVIYGLVLIVFRILPGPAFLLLLVSIPLFLFNCAWLALAAGILSTRFRDIPQVIASLLQVVFFLTPVFWSIETMPDRPSYVTFNPLYHLLEIVREPLLGRLPLPMSWFSSLLLALAGALVTSYLWRRAYARIPYWV